MYNLASKFLAPLFDPLTARRPAGHLGAAGREAPAPCRASPDRLRPASPGLQFLDHGGRTRALLGRPIRGPAEDLPPAQAIVVLGGALHTPSARHPATGLVEASDRLLETLRLYRSGKAPLVLCSGGDNPIGHQTSRLSEAAWMARLLEEWNCLVRSLTEHAPISANGKVRQIGGGSLATQGKPGPEARG